MLITNKCYAIPHIAQYILFLVAISLLWNCEKPDAVISKEIDTFTIAHQITIGEVMEEQLATMPEIYPILDKAQNKCAYERIEVLFKTLLNTSIIHNRRTFNWQIHLIDNEELINAFSLPGGHIFLYTGLLKFIETESELMAVLGNEIAYTDNEYILNTLRAEHGNSVMSDLSLGKSIPSLSEMLTDLPYLGFDKTTILQADSVSLALICPFQYDANSLKNFIEKAADAKIAWTISKGGNIEDRVSKISSAAISCGTEEATFEERYQSFLGECF